MASVVLVIAGLLFFGSMVVGLVLMIFGMLSPHMSRDDDLQWAGVVHYVERAAIAGLIGIVAGGVLSAAGL